MNHRSESRVREIRLHGSEGGEVQDNGPSLPLSLSRWAGSKVRNQVFLTPFHHPSLALPRLHPSVHRIPVKLSLRGGRSGCFATAMQAVTSISMLSRRRATGGWGWFPSVSPGLAKRSLQTGIATPFKVHRVPATPEAARWLFAAARKWPCSSTSSNRSDRRLEMPDSSIVTP